MKRSTHACIKEMEGHLKFMEQCGMNHDDDQERELVTHKICTLRPSTRRSWQLTRVSEWHGTARTHLLHTYLLIEQEHLLLP